ncbi:MAG: DUF5606 domain-containing protein [Cyclobacteriaceae bacterium]
MELSEIASITGKGGLFQVLKPTRTGMIVETLDEQKKKLVIGVNQRVSVLKEVSIYTTSAEGAVPLEDVFQKIFQEFGDDPGVDTSDGEELKAFLKHVVPDYDEDRVYVSDMKKLVNWYGLLLKYAPEVLTPEDAKKEEKPAESASAETPKEEAEATAESPAEEATATDKKEE